MAQSNVQTPVKILVPFATTRFSSEEQITASLPVWSVKSSVTEKLQAAVKTVQNVKLTFATKEADKDYALFVIAPTSWMLRETVATKLSGTTGYCLSIEASVN